MFCARTTTDADPIPSDLHFYYQASKLEMRVISVYFTQNIVCCFFHGHTSDHAIAADIIL